MEKATEIGVNQITPIVTKYSEKKKVNHERLERISISSLKQSSQFFKPQINEIENNTNCQNEYDPSPCDEINISSGELFYNPDVDADGNFTAYINNFFQSIYFK